MIDTEISAFVEAEVAARYKDGLNDTQRADWIRAVRKAGDFSVAQQLVRDLVEEPDAKLSVKAFYRLLKRRHKPERRVTISVFRLRRTDIPWPDVPFYTSIVLGHRPVAAVCETKSNEMREAFVNLYGGTWLVVRDWEKNQMVGVRLEDDVDYVDRSQLKPIRELRRLRLQAATQNDAPEHWEFG